MSAKNNNKTLKERLRESSEEKHLLISKLNRYKVMAKQYKEAVNSMESKIRKMKEIKDEEVERVQKQSREAEEIME